MTRTPGWANHLIATQSAVREPLAKIRRLAVEGAPLGGVGGQPLTPIPTDEWKRLELGLEAIEAEMTSLVEKLAPAEVARQVELRPRAVTRHHLLLALTMLREEQIDDIEPARGSHYAPLELEDRSQLEESAKTMRAIIAYLRNEVRSE